jgi:hypothetical protein
VLREIPDSSRPYIAKWKRRCKSGRPRVSTTGVAAPTTHGD